MHSWVKWFEAGASPPEAGERARVRVAPSWEAPGTQWLKAGSAEDSAQWDLGCGRVEGQQDDVAD